MASHLVALLSCSLVWHVQLQPTAGTLLHFVQGCHPTCDFNLFHYNVIHDIHMIDPIYIPLTCSPHLPQSLLTDELHCMMLSPPAVTLLSFAEAAAFPQPPPHPPDTPLLTDTPQHLTPAPPLDSTLFCRSCTTPPHAPPQIPPHHKHPF